MHPNKDLFVEYQGLKAPIWVDGIAGNRPAVGAGLIPIVDDRGNVTYLAVPPVIHNAHQAGSHS